MANRTRNIQIKFNVSEDERELIHAKMQELGTKNMGAYLRKVAVDGYIIKKDYSGLKENTAALNKIGVNINQIAKRINENGRIYDSDISDLKRMIDRIWQLQKSMLSKEL